MKVLNLGNDYALQRKRSAVECTDYDTSVSEAPKKDHTNQEKYAGNKDLSSGQNSDGEEKIAATDFTDNEENPQESKRGRKKKLCQETPAETEISEV